MLELHDLEPTTSITHVEIYMEIFSLMNTHNQLLGSMAETTSYHQYLLIHFI